MTNEYAAGFFDGEGCIITQAKSRINRRRVAVSANQVDIRPLTVLHQQFGGHLKFRDNKYGGSWNWTIVKRDDVERFLRAVRPHLIVKAEQCDVALQYIHVARNLQDKEDDTQLDSLHNTLKWLKTREALT